MVAQGFVVDLNKPLVFQVGHLGEYYQEWVHQPIVSKEGPRFFESNFWEFLTRTVWWAIPTIWLPVVCWCISWSAQMGHTASELVLMVILGIFIWTLIEYTLHRFLFHIKTKGYWANTMHYLIHGCHHKHPMDGLRLVFPPAATAVLCIPFWNLVRIFATPSTTPALFGGGLLGYVMYDVTHYYLHHGQPTSDVPKNLKVGLRMNWRSTMGRMPSDHRIRHEMYAKGGPGTCLGKCVDASQDLPCEVCMVVSRLVLGCLLDSPGSRLRKCVWVILGPISGCVPSDLKTSFRLHLGWS